MAETVEYEKKCFVEWMKQVEKCSIALAGQDAVKAEGKELLPQSNGMDGAAYAHYLRRAAFINFANKTVEAWHGALHRKKAVLNASTVLSGYAKDFDLAGNSLEESIKQTTYRILGTSRHAVYLDWSDELDRPYARHIRGCDIINWTENYVNGIYQPTMIVEKQEKEISDPNNIFATDDCFDEYLVHYLHPTTGIYEIQYFKNKGGDSKAEYVETITPTPTGSPLNYIPMVVFTDKGLTLETHKPVVIDVVDVNLTYYMCYADYLWGSYWTVMPTYLFSGIPVESKNDIVIGGQTALVTDNDNAKGNIIQYSGTAIPELRQNLNMLQDILSKLGASLLQQAMKQPQTAEAVAVNNSGQSSILANLTNTVEEGYQRILNWMSEWIGEKADETSLQLNRDYVEDGWSTDDVKNWFDALVMNAVTSETYVNQMNKKEMYPSNFDAQTEIKRLEDLIESGQATMSNGVNQLTNMNSGRTQESNINSITTNIPNNSQ